MTMYRLHDRQIRRDQRRYIDRVAVCTFAAFTLGVLLTVNALLWIH